MLIVDHDNHTSFTPGSLAAPYIAPDAACGRILEARKMFPYSPDPFKFSDMAVPRSVSEEIAWQLNKGLSTSALFYYDHGVLEYELKFQDHRLLKALTLYGSPQMLSRYVMRNIQPADGEILARSGRLLLHNSLGELVAAYRELIFVLREAL